MREDTLFHVTSLTKPVTCAGIMTLVDEGRLALDDPLEKYVPAFARQRLWNGKPPASPITIRHLMTHMSGLLDSISPECLRSGFTLAELLAAAASQPLGFDPGTRWFYNNLGIVVAGGVIEAVAGESYGSFIGERIFRPLGMSNSFFRLPRSARARLAVHYAEEDRGLVREPENLLPEDAGFVSPANALYSTAGDLARFLQMMLNQGELDGRRVLSKKSALSMTTSHTGAWEAGFVPGAGYGLGFSIVNHPTGVFRNYSRGSFGHGGNYQGHAWADPGKGLIVVVLFQHRCIDKPIGEELAELLGMAAAA